jgi:hypothetical protein
MFCDNDQSNDCEYMVCDPVELTSRGEDMKWLYDLYLATDGWWQAYIADGVDPLLLFLAIILSIEWSPAWLNTDPFEVGGSGWGSGVEGQDPLLYLSQATSTWFWDWEPMADAGTPLFENYAPGSLNSVLNWIGSNSGSAQKIFENVYWASTRPLSEIATSEERLLFLMPESKWNPELLDVASDVLDPPDPSWRTAEGWTWGNEKPPLPGYTPVYQWDVAYIYAPIP